MQCSSPSICRALPVGGQRGWEAGLLGSSRQKATPKRPGCSWAWAHLALLAQTALLEDAHNPFLSGSPTKQASFLPPVHRLQSLSASQIRAFELFQDLQLLRFRE